MGKIHSSFSTFSRWKLIHEPLNVTMNDLKTDLLPSNVEVDAFLQFVSFEKREQFIIDQKSEESIDFLGNQQNRQQIDKKLRIIIVKVLHHLPILQIKVTFTWLEKIQENPNITKIYPNLPLYLCMNQVNKLFSITRIHNSFYEFQGRSIYVGLLDTGIDPTHPDLLTRVDDTINVTTEEVGDFNGHGTMMAGIIAGSGRASKGEFRGIAPECKLLDIKIFTKNGSATISELIEALDRILDRVPATRPHILVFGGIPIALPPSEEPDLLMQYCQLILQQKIMIITPTGNFGPDPEILPMIASISDILMIGATNFDRKTTFFSDQALQPSNLNIDTPKDYGKVQSKPDCFFPGVNIVAPRAFSGQIGSIFSENENYIVISGTSTSTAIATGFLVLLKEAFPKASIHDLIQLVRCRKGEFPDIRAVLSKANLYYPKPLSINKWIGIALLFSLGFCMILLGLYYLFQIL